MSEVANHLRVPSGAKAVLRAFGPLAVGTFLKRSEFHRTVGKVIPHPALLTAFQHWAASQPSVDEPSLNELILAAGLPDFRKWSTEFLNEENSFFRTETIGGLAVVREISRARYRSLIVSLETFITNLRAARVADTESRPLAPELTGEPRLDAFRVSAAALRQSRRAIYPLHFFGADLALLDEGLSVGVDCPFSPSEATVSFDGNGTEREPIVPRCSCSSTNCVHVVVALEAMLDATDDPRSPMAQKLVARLAPKWQQALVALSSPKATEVEDAGTLAFVIGPRAFELSFRKQLLKGRQAKPKRIDRPADYINRVSGAERRFLELFTLALAQAQSRHRLEHSVFFGDALLLLEGHPGVTWEGQSQPSPLVSKRAAVVFKNTDQGVDLSVALGPSSEQALSYRSTSGRVVPAFENGTISLCIVSNEVASLSSTLRRYGSNFPKEAIPELTQMLPSLEAGASVELPEDLKGDQVPTTNRAIIRIDSRADGFVLALRSEPLVAGAVFLPGQGVSVSATFDGRRRRFAQRAFDLEVSEAARVMAELGLDASTSFEPYTWHLEASDKTIELLRRVHHLEAQNVGVEYKTRAPRFTAAGRLEQLNLRIEKKRDWFGLDGELHLDDRRVALAQLLEAARHRRRWVKLGDNDYAELSEGLLEKLSPLAHLGDDGKGIELTLGTMPLIDSLEGQVESLEAAREWRDLTERLAAASNKRFHVPKALKADLRDYQVEGFRWLSRLAEWGAGACLADDMGLGKTLQALTLLVSRAALGPALVVAPASVLHTWRAEAAKFAPSLSVSLFHESSRDVSSMKAGEVWVVSWSLLAREIESLEARSWATVVFDEAHAIKNSGTLRARAAQRVKGQFKVALSGTPVENHIGELWSLFRAVMPSLFGSEESFRRRFGTSSPEALKALSVLIQPFVLRRSKSQVARELPERTDVEIVIPLSTEEKALYDDVRLSAMADLADGELGEDKRFQVLAAMTRLRLTACHPKLIDDAWQGPTSKLTRLLELLKDLAAGDHRVLVFSQFTKHLALVRQACQHEGITFSYLDGQVPVAERQRRVELFQKGQGGDVFLISLKAGGTGLTLTAADYVIHLDPWWNPAVEDQASDRAHRIGQSRPVTVYRLIAEATIEQQIVSMHAEKRELVDSLLAGTETAGRLTTEALASLIRAPPVPQSSSLLS